MSNRYLFLYESGIERVLLSEVQSRLGNARRVSILPLEEAHHQLTPPDAIVCVLESRKALNQAEVINHKWPGARFILINSRGKKIPIETATNGYDHIFFGERETRLPQKIVQLLAENESEVSITRWNTKKSLQSALKAVLLAGQDGRKIIQDTLNTLAWELSPKKAVAYWADPSGCLHLVNTKGRSDAPRTLESNVVGSLLATWPMVTQLRGRNADRLLKWIRLKPSSLLLQFQEEGELLGLIGLESHDAEDLMMDQLETLAKCVAYALHSARQQDLVGYHQTEVGHLMQASKTGLISLSDTGDILGIFGEAALQFFSNYNSLPRHLRFTKGEIRSCLLELLEEDHPTRTIADGEGDAYLLTAKKSEPHRLSVLVTPQKQSVLTQNVFKAFLGLNFPVRTEVRLSEVLNKFKESRDPLEKIKIRYEQKTDGVLSLNLSFSLLIETLELAIALMASRAGCKEIALQAKTTARKFFLEITAYASEAGISSEPTSECESAQKLLGNLLQLEEQKVRFTFQEAQFGLLLQVSGPLA